MFCHHCGAKLPDIGTVNYCSGCGKAVVSKVVNRIVERNGIYYEPIHNKPFSGKYVSRDSAGKIVQEVHYKDGLADGFSTTWHKNGQKESEGLYKSGKQEGLWTWWNDQGQQIIEKYYKNGLKHGLWIDWHANGQKKVEGTFINGKREGVVTIWNKEGKKISETLYKNDERV